MIQNIVCHWTRNRFLEDWFYCCYENCKYGVVNLGASQELELEKSIANSWLIEIGCGFGMLNYDIWILDW
ncbi:hypothetical protein SDJN03_14552, partial [Cucurbita argyrosperma subsp. sororia]